MSPLELRAPVCKEAVLIYINPKVMAFSLQDLAFKHATRTPEATALTASGDLLSYGKLAQRANAIAIALISHGLRRGERVGIYMDRSFGSISSILGIMRAGGVYVPFDSESSVERLAAIVDDCGIALAFVDESHAEAFETVRFLSRSAPKRLSIHEFDHPSDSGPVHVDVIEQDLCLIFYTSGSTGRPKGVAHSHRSMISNVEWALETFALSSKDVFAHVTSHHFDLCWFEMFVSLAAGAKLLLVPERVVKFPSELSAMLATERVSIWCSVPSVLISLVQRGQLAERDLSALRRIHFAGERFPTPSLRRLMKLVPHADFTNMYGTTETHIAAWYPVPNPLCCDDPLPIGRPCSHVQLEIVDSKRDPVAPGESGELLIRGPSMMEGYWRLPERTANAIIELGLSPEAKGRFYRSGDFARRRPDGFIEIIGRADRRVKVRGYLVDLDEIECVLLQDHRVLESACFLVGEQENGLSHIEAGVRLKAGAVAASAELRLHVAAKLSNYAVPEVIEIFDDLPRTGSGKVDRRELAKEVSARRMARRELISDHDPRVTLRTFLAQEFLDISADELSDDTPLMEDGLIDSTGVVLVVSFIEERFNISVSNDEFVADNFATVSAMVRLVERLRRSG
jgi:amino acid adenylation domain-containing protein